MIRVKTVELQQSAMPMKNTRRKDTVLLELGTVYFRWSVPAYWLTGLALTTTLVLRSVG